jgi:hypothetical protein
MEFVAYLFAVGLGVMFTLLLKRCPKPKQDEGLKPNIDAGRK